MLYGSFLTWSSFQIRYIYTSISAVSIPRYFDLIGLNLVYNPYLPFIALYCLGSYLERERLLVSLL